MGASAIFPAEPASLAQIRHEVAKAASQAGLRPGRIQELQIACGEAATNAVEHAYGKPGGAIQVRMFSSGDWFRVEIEDQGRWREPQERGAGRGLVVMRGFADEVDIVRDDHGTTVRLAVRIHPETRHGSKRSHAA